MVLVLDYANCNYFINYDFYNVLFISKIYIKKKVEEVRRFFKLVVIVLLAIVLVTGTLLGALADPVVEGFVINGSEIPFERDVLLNVTLSFNHSLFVERIDDEDRLNIIFPNVTVFVNDSEQITFHVLLADEVSYSDSLVSLFNLSSDLNNVSFLYSIVINVTVPNQSVVNDSSGFFINLVGGDYLVEITTDLLPKNGSLSYAVHGLAGSLLNISCDPGWIVCPESSVFDDGNLTSFVVDYLIPINALLGNHSYNIVLSTENISRNTSVVFSVIEPDINLLSYQFGDDCFREVDGLLLVTYDCLQAQEEHNIRRLSSVMARLRTLQNDSYCDPEKITKYVLAGDINKTVWDDYTTCRSERTDVTSMLREANDQVLSIQNDYDICQTKLLLNESTCLSNVFSTGVRMKKEAEEYKAGVWKGVWTLIIVILILFGLIFAGNYWYKSKKQEAWYQ